MMTTLLKRLRGAFVIAYGALVLITAAGPLATPAHAQAAHVPAQGQPEQPDQPRRPHAGDPTTTPAPPPPLSPETTALRSKLDASKLDLDQVPGRPARLDQRPPRDALARHSPRRGVQRHHSAGPDPDRDGAGGQHGPAPPVACADRCA